MNGEGAPHRLLQPTYVTCTCCRSSDSRCVRATFVIRHQPPGSPPPDTPGRFAFDDASRASVEPPLTPPPIRRLRASLNPGGLRYRRALEGTPLDPWRFLPRVRSARRPLTPPVTTSLASFAEPACARPPPNPSPAARAAFLQGPVKDPASARPEAPSIVELPARSNRSLRSA
jgi:hypothetical protein